MGDENKARGIVSALIKRGADVNLPWFAASVDVKPLLLTSSSRFTDMTPIQYAAFFGASKIAEVLEFASKFGT